MLGFRAEGSEIQCSQGLQYPLIKEYSLNHIGDLAIFYGIFLNSGTLASLGSRFRIQGLRFRISGLGSKVQTLNSKT